MLRFGGFLAFIGFGSALLHFTDIQFRLVIWAEDMQPMLGLGVGAVGALIMGIAYAVKKDKPAQPVGAAYPPPPPHGQPYPPQPPQYGPQQQYGPPPGFAPQGPPPQYGQGFGPQSGQSFGPQR